MPISKKRKKKGRFGFPTKPKRKTELKKMYDTLSELDNMEADLIRKAAHEKKDED